MEELDFQALLDHFNQKGFQRGEQVILGHFGTVQTLLSLIFMVPVNVHDIEMEEERENLYRRVKLKAGGHALVCEAESRIPKFSNPGILRDVTEAKLGLGQIVVKHQIPNKRVLKEVGRNSEAFWRTYTIEGPNLFIEIHEHFPRKPFEEAKWLKPEGG